MVIIKWANKLCYNILIRFLESCKLINVKSKTSKEIEEIMDKRILLASPHMSDEGFEREYVKEAFDTNWIAPLGKNVNEFEKSLADFVGSKEAAALVSGTSAIHLALKASGVGQGDTVLVQDLTFSATVNPIIYLNAKPVFIDSDEKTWNMDPDALEKALEKYPDAKAVVVVHLYGIAADLDRIVDICNKHNVVLIEDSCESLGTTYKGKQTGTFGKFGTFSFNGNKIITTSGGGMVVSDDQEAIKKIRFWSTQSREACRHYEHKELGYNYRLSNVCAGIGRGQMKVLKDRIAKKTAIYNKYSEEFADLEGVTMMPNNDFNIPNFWLSSLQVSGDLDALKIIEGLDENNIEARPVWKPMHMQPYFEKYDYIGTGVSEKLYKNGICLPSDTKMTDDELQYVCDVFKKLVKNI